MAASTPPVVLPKKVLGKTRTQSPFSKYKTGDTIRTDTFVNLDQNIRNFRGGLTAAATMRSLFEADSLVSTAITNFIALATTDYKINAYDTGTQEFSYDGVVAAEAVLSTLDTVYDYSKGYADRQSLSALVEQMMLEVLVTGGVGAELVLNDQRFPDRIAVFAYDSITWKSRGDGTKFPTQKAAAGGDDIELNSPNIWVAETLKPANRLYSLPVLHSGLTSLFQYRDYLQDVWRVTKQSGLPRLVVTLDHEKVVNSASVEVKQDPAKLATYLDTVRAGIEDTLKNLSPEDALVVYDLGEVTSISSSGEKKDFRELMQEFSGLAASALKSNPSLLGLRLDGSQAVSTTEAMIAVKTAQVFRRPIEELLSRALTLAVRLYGVDVYCEFKLDEIDLRPSAELEAHRTMRQQRILELLSLGRITDSEAQSMLGLGSLPDSADELSGTNFLNPKPADTVPASGTNARNAAIAPDGAKSGGGKDNSQRV